MQKRSPKKLTGQKTTLSWLPIDSRIIPPIFSFGHVKGLARIFLLIEMVSACLVVIGTFAVVAISVFR